MQWMLAALHDKLPQLRDLCRVHHVRRLEAFGSAARDGGADFDPQRSDLDFLVEFEPHSRKGFDDVYFKLLADLEATRARRTPCFGALKSSARRPTTSQANSKSSIRTFRGRR
jgi:predicted nucleotidyltransferase